VFCISAIPYLTVLFPSEHSRCIPLRSILHIAASLIVAGNFLSRCVPHPMSLHSPIREHKASWYQFQERERQCSGLHEPSTRSFLNAHLAYFYAI
jgi:hypothetical protein